MIVGAGSGTGSIPQTSSGNMVGAGGANEGSAEAIFEKMKADAIKNGWKSAEVKNIQALIRSGSGQ
ncbi:MULTISPECIES: type III secretion protein [Pseudomonas]|uniref:type III secretion protein n=1 Tax=Pseudomonas TaxID=286 RepID=UPI00117AA886|nr:MULTISPECIES: type III secretion protein [Pseudomonas]MCK3838369.1 type III secretion protein [Pseudomonas sp. NCIMB 10586]MCK3842657.1 type III secretion protein [Pseudomonas sp. W15Feb34]MCK3863668.1 type III secretion protein [Pseudomonas sp. B329]